MSEELSDTFISVLNNFKKSLLNDCFALYFESSANLDKSTKSIINGLRSFKSSSSGCNAIHSFFIPGNFLIVFNSTLKSSIKETQATCKGFNWSPLKAEVVSMICAAA